MRTELVTDAGIPTDRVELTSRTETGQADSEPGDAFVARVANYFHTLLDQDGRHNGEVLHRNKPVAVEEIR